MKKNPFSHRRRTERQLIKRYFPGLDQNDFVEFKQAIEQIAQCAQYIDTQPKKRRAFVDLLRQWSIQPDCYQLIMSTYTNKHKSGHQIIDLIADEDQLKQHDRQQYIDRCFSLEILPLPFDTQDSQIPELPDDIRYKPDRERLDPQWLLKQIQLNPLILLELNRFRLYYGLDEKMIGMIIADNPILTPLLTRSETTWYRKMLSIQSSSSEQSNSNVLDFYTASIQENLNYEQIVLFSGEHRDFFVNNNELIEKLYYLRVDDGIDLCREQCPDSLLEIMKSSVMHPLFHYIGDLLCLERQLIADTNPLSTEALERYLDLCQIHAIQPNESLQRQYDDLAIEIIDHQLIDQVRQLAEVIDHDAVLTSMERERMIQFVNNTRFLKKVSCGEEMVVLKSVEKGVVTDQRTLKLICEDGQLQLVRSSKGKRESGRYHRVSFKDVYTAKQVERNKMGVRRTLGGSQPLEVALDQLIYTMKDNKTSVLIKNHGQECRHGNVYNRVWRYYTRQLDGQSLQHYLDGDGILRDRQVLMNNRSKLLVDMLVALHFGYINVDLASSHNVVCSDIDELTIIDFECAKPSQAVSICLQQVMRFGKEKQQEYINVLRLHLDQNLASLAAILVYFIDCLEHDQVKFDKLVGKIDDSDPIKPSLLQYKPPDLTQDQAAFLKKIKMILSHIDSEIEAVVLTPVMGRILWQKRQQALFETLKQSLVDDLNLAESIKSTINETKKPKRVITTVVNSLKK